MLTIQGLWKKICAKTKDANPQDQLNKTSLQKHTQINKQIETVCHDLNTPLATLEIVASLIQNKINPKEYELLISAVQRIREVGTDLAKLPLQ